MWKTGTSMLTASDVRPEPMAPMIRIFGAVDVTDVDGPVGIGGPRQRRLLALLAIRAGRVVDHDWLAEYLWDDDDRPEASSRAIRTYLSRLRQALPDAAQGWIETAPAGYRLVAPAESIEHLRFAALRAEATSARERDDPLAAHRLLDEALALWRGTPFRELEDLDWVQAHREQLELDRLEMLEERWEAALALGRHTQITGELAAFTIEHRHRDRAVRQHALALHRSGRTPEALRVISDHRRFLTDESGLDPSPATVELEDALLRGDRSLDVELVGRPLRGYQLLEAAGAGAFSVVWRGMQPSVGREVAIKQIRSELASQPHFIRRFEAEAHLVARVEHPHIVPLIDYWRDPDSAYLVMRWLPGGTLERRLDDGPLDVDETLVLARHVGAALGAAHAHGIVHRDVKTANILFDDAGNAFLADFGIALEAAESAGPEAALSPGTPAYASPEQIRRERLGPAADVFSLGVVVFECLVGRTPFADSTSAQETIARQLREPIPSLAELRPDVPSALSEAVARATAKDPNDRFLSVSEFVAALGSPATEAVAAPVEPGRPPVDADLDHPYLGLRAFDDVDADRFFGRERLVDEMVGRLAGDGVGSRCLFVVGPSGSGKSSVVRAGLVPAVRRGAVQGSDDWFVTTMVPGDDPFESLEAALLRVAVNPAPTLLEQLRDGERGVLRSVRRCLGRDEQRLLLVIDQFEELFIGRSAADAHAFLTALTVGLEDPSTPLRVVATLRADFYDRPLGHPSFAPILKAGAVEVTPLAGDELERTIVEPARRVGVEFEPGLVARIAAETLGQPSPLPLLQYTLSELFDRRRGALLTEAAYDEVGGLSGALSARAERIHEVGDARQRTGIRHLFGRMTNVVGGTVDLRRRVPLADVAHDPAVAWALERFGEARLLTFDRDEASREPTVEVAHEALLREWKRLAGWLRDDAELLRRLEMVAAGATTWDQAGRDDSDLARGSRLEAAIEVATEAGDRLRPLDREFVDASNRAAEAERRRERARVRNLRRLVAVVAMALVLALVAGAVALRQRNEARSAAEEAELATLISRSAALSGDDPDVATLLALEAHRRRPGSATERAVLNALAGHGSVGRVQGIERLDTEDCSFPSFVSRDGSVEHGVVGGQILALDLTTGVTTGLGTAPAACVAVLGDRQADVRVVHSDDFRSYWFGPYDGPADVEVTLDQQMGLLSRSAPAGLVVLGAGPGDDLTMTFVDARTGETVGAPLTGLHLGEWGQSWGPSPGGELYAIGTITPEGPDTFGRVLVVDPLTTDIVHFTDIAAPATALVFDLTADELVAGDDRGSLVTIDLGTGSIVSQVATSASSRFFSLGVRSDGLIVAVSEGQVEIVDRERGPVGAPIPVRDLADARVRPDGTVLVIDNTGRAELIDPERSALVDEIWDIDRGSRPAFAHGMAGLAFASQPPQVLDLATGDRTAYELATPDGTALVPLNVIPTDDGFLVLDEQMTFWRWNGGRLVETKAARIGETARTHFETAGFVSSGAVLGVEEGVWEAHLLDLATLEVQLSVLTEFEEVSAVPTGDGGLHLMDRYGVLRTYDASGDMVAEIATGSEWLFAVSRDAVSGRLAYGGIGGALVVDPELGTVERLDGLGPVASLGFVRGGELLVLVGNDGTVRLWGVGDGATAGLVWEGGGGAPLTPPWYDESTDSVWVASSGQLIEIPLDPEVWVERACDVVGRELTAAEWARHVPGDEPQRTACG